ncbi:energy-coupling factor transporter transmembrane component T family protein [Paenibacillus sp. FA6]|uniref:energy-coupling factor transporter transmembrane component T family protein n=1 Tax=Paenibacillus sp. FA6 TaxID=3413029 RepID=UPI003F659E90
MSEKLLIGRTIDTGSWVHSLDPRAKMIAMLLYVVMIIMSNTWIEMVCMLLFSMAVIASTRIHIKYYVRAAKPLWILMVFIFIVQCLKVVDKNGIVLMSIGTWNLYLEGFRLGLFAVLRMVFLVSFTAILTFTTTPGRLNQGLEGVLKPLHWIKVSPDRLTLMISIALRFIPTILEETQIILKAQASRGADLKELPWKEKGKMLVSLLVPVTVGAFRRAEDLVHSMESRGFRIREPRTKYHRLIWRKRDTLFISLFIIMVIVVVWMSSSASGDIWTL